MLAALAAMSIEATSELTSAFAFAQTTAAHASELLLITAALNILVVRDKAIMSHKGSQTLEIINKMNNDLPPILDLPLAEHRRRCGRPAAFGRGGGVSPGSAGPITGDCEARAGATGLHEGSIDCAGSSRRRCQLRCRHCCIRTRQYRCETGGSRPHGGIRTAPAWGL